MPRKARRGVLIAALSIGAVLMIFPFIWTVITSITASGDVLTTPRLIPQHPGLDGYHTLFAAMPFWRIAANSLVLAVVSTLLLVGTSAMAAYAFARLPFRGKGVVFVGYLATLMVPMQVLVVPLFIEVRTFDLVDTYASLIVPTIASAFGVFLLRQSIAVLPTELDEAAFIDGAGHIRIFLRIILPLIRPALATYGLFAFMSSWNAFLWRAWPDEAYLARCTAQLTRVAYVAASRLIRASLRAGLLDAACWLQRHLNVGYAVRGGTRAVPGSRAGTGRCHCFCARTAVAAAGIEDQRDCYQSGGRQQPQQQHRGPLETQAPACPAQAEVLPVAPEPPQRPPRGRRRVPPLGPGDRRAEVEVTIVIARSDRQSRRDEAIQRLESLDCFALLAMTTRLTSNLSAGITHALRRHRPRSPPHLRPDDRPP